MAQDTYNQLISNLGKSVGIKDLTPDEDDYCCLGFDEKVVIHFQYNAEHDILMLFAQLGTLDADKAALLYPRMMHANLFWQGTGGATLGVDMDTREVILSYQLALQLLDEKRFHELVEGFVNTAELWINTLDVIQKGGDIKTATGK